MKKLWAAIFLFSVIGLLVVTGLNMIYPESEKLKRLIYISFILTGFNGIILTKED